MSRWHAAAIPSQASLDTPTALTAAYWYGLQPRGEQAGDGGWKPDLLLLVALDMSTVNKGLQRRALVLPSFCH